MPSQTAEEDGVSSDAGPHPSSTEHALEVLVKRARAMGREPQAYPAGSRVLGEGDANHSLYVLLKGEVLLSKTGRDHQPMELDHLGPGDLLGILSFWTGKPSFSDSHALTDMECLVIDQEQFDQGVADDPEFTRVTLQLLVANLSNRYRRVVGLNLEVAGLTQDLEQERNALREAVEDLKQTRNQLVHREKLATMGQLLAGIAHEINNPSSSLLQNVSSLIETLPSLFASSSLEAAAFAAGQQASFQSATETRERMASLAKRFPALRRSVCRKCSRLTPDLLEAVAPALEQGDLHPMESMLQAFEVGAALHSIRVADERITRLVKSLKSYSRQDEGEVKEVDVGQCVRDTLMVLGHRLKAYDVQLDLPELPPIPGRAGEINQILTNLLTNATEATPGGKEIRIQVRQEAGMLVLEVLDQGHGIPDALMGRLFEPNVTTKSGGGDYGLGLGLAISQDLAMQHRGSLSASNRPEGGAVFRLELPCHG